MALPQTVDPSTLNLSGKPAIATAPTTTTTAESVGMPAPTIAQEKSNVSPLLGALFGGALGMKYASSQAGRTGTGTGAGGTGASGTGNLLSNLIKAVTSGGTPTGNIGSVNNVIVPAGMSGTEAQNWLNTNYGMTNGQPNYVVSGSNLSTGEIIGLPNTNIGGANLGTNTGNYGTTGDGSSSTGTGTLTNIGSGYFMDDNSNVYDSNGNLIYQNPSSTTGTQTEPSGGGYDPNATDTSGGYFQDSLGDIYDSLGNLVLAFNNGYYYEPDTGNFYDSTTFEPVGTDFNAYTDYFNIPTLDTSSYGDLGNYFDYGNYYSGSTTYIKDGGSVRKGGLATPLFAKGGYADGDLVTATPTSFTDQVVANQVPVATATTTPTTTSTTSTGTSGSILDSILSFAQNNPAITGAGLGALLTQLINSSSSYPVNKGVDMTALGTLKPRTTPTGPARYVPYSEYGTPTSSFDYSKLYENLGVSPFGGGVVSPSTPTSATPTPTTPTGALSALTPTTPTAPVTAPTTPTTPTAPTYYSDADGNIYDADGNLVFDTTTGSATASTGTIASPTSTAPAMSGLAVPTSTLDASYSYGTPVSPSEVLGAKKGGLAVKKMADGGMSNLAVTSFASPSDSMGGLTYYDLQKGWTQDELLKAIRSFYPSNMSPWLSEGQSEQDYLNSIANLYNGLTGTPIRLRSYNQQPDGGFQLGLDPNNTQYIPSDLYAQEFNVTSSPTNISDVSTTDISSPLPYERNDVSVTSTGTDFPINYNDGMPQQVEDLMPTQGGLMPQQGTAMPTQGSAMPQQTPFSTSPTFRFSGANNPLLVGLRQNMPDQQPFMLSPSGQFVPREEISTSRTYGGYATGGSPRGMTAKDQLAMSSGMYGSVPYSSGVVTTPSMIIKGGYRPFTTPIPATPSPTQYLNKQYLDTWQKSFPGFRAPSLDGKGSYGSPFMSTLGGIYGKPYSMGGQPTTENLNVPVSNRPFQNVPEIQGRGDYRQGSYVEGAGDGQSDDIPAMLADGEYVIDAETVAQLGNGSNKAGAKVLDEFRKNVRAHKRSAPHDKIPPKAKSALAYLKGAK